LTKPNGAHAFANSAVSIKIGIMTLKLMALYTGEQKDLLLGPHSQAKTTMGTTLARTGATSDLWRCCGRESRAGIYILELIES